MSEIVKLKPAGKNLVRNPDTNGHLEVQGEPIALTSYWRRRIKDGDVKQIDEEPAKESK